MSRYSVQMLIEIAIEIRQGKLPMEDLKGLTKDELEFVRSYCRGLQTITLLSRQRLLEWYSKNNIRAILNLSKQLVRSKIELEHMKTQKADLESYVLGLKEKLALSLSEGSSSEGSSWNTIQINSVMALLMERQLTSTNKEIDKSIADIARKERILHRQSKNQERLEQGLEVVRRRVQATTLSAILDAISMPFQQLADALG